MTYLASAFNQQFVKSPQSCSSNEKGSEALGSFSRVWHNCHNSTFWEDMHMSIINEEKNKNPLIVGIREQLEHRALWMYLLCNHAMCGDRGIAESFGCELNLPATIARGDDTCQIRFVRREKKENG